MATLEDKRSAEMPLARVSIVLLVAVADNGVIGRDNGLPFRQSSDLKRFKALTMGKPVLMGRKTFESIGKALPGRLNIVMSRSAGFSPLDCVVVKTLDDARLAAGMQPELMVIGGSELYRQCLPFARRIHLTLIHTRIEDGDTLFAGWRGAEWQATARERHEADEKNLYAYSFITLDRRGPHLG